jgi:hypothetical protein
MRKIAVVLLVAACGGRAKESSFASTDGTGATPDAGAAVDGGPSSSDAGPANPPPPPAPVPPPAAPSGPSLAGCPMFPPDNDWNRDVSGEPVDSHSDAYLATLGASWRNLHADFGSSPEYGIPFVIVPGSQPREAMSFVYAGESDPGPYPYPADIPVQGGAGATGDRHAIALDRDSCLLYETYDTHWTGDGYSVGSGAVFDLRSGRLRPDSWTSATASGLPILPGLARYDEVVEQAEVRHALTFTAAEAAPAWVHPATHYGYSANPDAPPMGTRVRLKASFDVSRYSGAARTILVALQKYGMFLVDQAQDGFVGISGATDSRWDDQDLNQLKSVPFSAFEVVQLPQVHRR